VLVPELRVPARHALVVEVQIDVVPASYRHDLGAEHELTRAMPE
jgi:hypothetical protein